MGSNLIPFQMYHYDHFWNFSRSPGPCASFEACCHDRVAFMHETTWLWDGMGQTVGDPIGTVASLLVSLWDEIFAPGSSLKLGRKIATWANCHNRS